MTAHNKIDRTNQVYGKLTALKDVGGGYWECVCTCGNTSRVLSSNLSGYARNERGCKHCQNRQDITGEKRGMLTAVSCETGVVTGRNPIWLFRCDCGGLIKGRVAEFRIGRLRNCKCHEIARASWHSMMQRCYNQSNLRYSSYGGRGITVCDRWHDFENFARDMGPRPIGHTLGRKNAEEGYTPDNCFWEHYSDNCRDTKNDGSPTKPGILKGAKQRRLQ